MLDQILPETIFSIFLVFARIGGMVMGMPGFGERSIPARVKLSLALVISIVVWPIVENLLPGMPTSVAGLAALITGELVTGIAIGLVSRFVLVVLSVAGTIIAFQTGLGFAQAFDPAQGTQGSLVTAFLTLVGITLIMVTDLHLMLIEAMFDSYEIFPPGVAPPVGDLAQAAIGIFTESFKLGFQLAGPSIVFALCFYLGMGIVARLAPQIQIFFVAMPINIMSGLALLGVIFPSLMLWYLENTEKHFAMFLR